MHLSPECLDSLKNRAFWESLQDEEVEHGQYNSELDTISKFYPDKTSEIGQKVVKWQKDFKASIVLLFNCAV
ncbi:hypothetical protein BC937DRAFT_89934 [Endogone sp. FLAS-F59071]|nr:hypothetical protein BC937DRAFT_89934 [Endogone sp. FLAS-F59071]|eukprot:RUS17472.1 hypothetical protein BC937DRAFT_89934 [Endogone sp. FLAS-F59071]